MAQRRMLSRRISQSKKVNALSLKAQLVWTWTHPFLDDYGRYTADPEDIKTEVFPKNKKISVNDIKNALAEEYGIGLIILYLVEDKPYQQYTKFEDHQTFRSDRERKAEYPEFTNISINNIDIINIEDKLSKEKGREALSPTDIPRHTKDSQKKKFKHLSDVYLTLGEYDSLLKRFGMRNTDSLIEDLDNYIGSTEKGRKYSSHYKVILTWAKRSGIKKPPDSGPGSTTKPYPRRPDVSPEDKKKISKNVKELTDNLARKKDAK